MSRWNGENNQIVNDRFVMGMIGEKVNCGGVEWAKRGIEIVWTCDNHE